MVTDELAALHEVQMVAYLRERGYVIRKPTLKNHGLRGTYASGCRCEPCRDAQSAYARRYYRKGAYYVTTQGATDGS